MESLYADMLEYRQQMREGVDFAHLKYTLAMRALQSLPEPVYREVLNLTW